MADLSQLNYNPANVENMGDGFKLVPPGIYNVFIVASDVKNTAGNTGKILELQCQIIDGQHVGEKLVDRLNIVNKSDTAQRIGLS